MSKCEYWEGIYRQRDPAVFHFLTDGASRQRYVSTPWGAEQEFVYCYCRMPG